MSRNEDQITEEVCEKMREAQPRANACTQVPIISSDGKKSGRIDLLWCSRSIVAMEAGFVGDSTTDDEAKGRLRTWKIGEAEVAIERAVSVQYPKNLKEVAKEEIAKATFEICIFRKHFTPEERRTVSGTAALASTLEFISWT